MRHKDRAASLCSAACAAGLRYPRASGFPRDFTYVLLSPRLGDEQRFLPKVDCGALWVVLATLDLVDDQAARPLLQGHYL